MSDDGGYLKKVTMFQAVLLCCVGVSLLLVLLPQPSTMIDFPMYNIIEIDGELTVETYSLTVSEEETVEALIGEGYALVGSLGGGVSSELHLIYHTPSENILSLSERGSATLMYADETIELDIGETRSKTIYHWLASAPGSVPIPSLLLGTLLYDTHEVKNFGYVDEITIIQDYQTLRFEEMKPILIEFWLVEGGMRFFVSPNLVIFALLLGWNTWKMKKQKEVS